MDFRRRIILDPPAELLRLGVVGPGGGGLVGFGYVIGPSSNWRRGLGGAAASAGLAYGFGILRLENLSMRETTDARPGRAGMRRFEITADEFPRAT